MITIMAQIQVNLSLQWSMMSVGYVALHHVEHDRGKGNIINSIMSKIGNWTILRSLKMF